MDYSSRLDETRRGAFGGGAGRPAGQVFREDRRHSGRRYGPSAHSGPPPSHKAAVREMAQLNRWLGGEMGEDEERVIAVEVNESLRGENQVSNEQRPEIQAVHEMNQIASSREGKEALQRAATGQELSPAQAALVNEYKAL